MPVLGLGGCTVVVVAAAVVVDLVCLLGKLKALLGPISGNCL